MSEDAPDRTPPRLAERLLEWCAPWGRIGQSVVGDAREEFEAHLDSGSRIPPGVWYWLHVLPIVVHGLLFGLGAAPGLIPAVAGAAARDLKLALRTLARRPGLTAAVVATLGVGMGGVTAALSVFDAALLDPLPYHEPERLVGIYRFRTTAPGGPPSASRAAGSYSVPPATFRDWQEGSRSFQAMGAMRRHEFGVRVALGGSQPGILRAVLLGGLKMAAVGIVVGLAVVLAVSRFMDPTLFPTGTWDPFVLGLVALVLAATGAGASVLPAYRATRVDPVATLRAP